MKVWEILACFALGFVLSFFAPDWVVLGFVGLALLYAMWFAWRRRKPEAGTLVLCVDCSGSMHGALHDWSNAMVESVLKRCRKTGRSLIVLPFDHTLLAAHVYPGGEGEFRPMPQGGGTAFEPVLTHALMAAGPGGEIAVLTDGYSQVKTHWVDQWNAERAALKVEVRTFTLGDDQMQKWGAKYAAQFSDHIIPVPTVHSPGDFGVERSPVEVAAIIQHSKES